MSTTLPALIANPLVATLKTISQKTSWRFARSARYDEPLGTRETSRKIARSADRVPIAGTAYPYRSR